MKRLLLPLTILCVSLAALAQQWPGPGYPAPGYILTQTTSTPTLWTDNTSAIVNADRYGALRVNTVPSTIVSSGATCGGISTSTLCLGLSGASLFYYVNSIFLTATAQSTLKVVAVTSTTNCATGTPIWPDTYVSAYGGGPIPLTGAIKLPAVNEGICCVVPQTSSSTCVINGWTAP